MQNPKIGPLGLRSEIGRGPKPAIANTSFLVSNTTFLEIQITLFILSSPDFRILEPNLYLT